MSLTRVQDVSVQDIHKRKKPRKHYVSSSVLLSFVLCQVATLLSPHVRESKTVLDSRFHTVDSRYCILQCLSVEFGFWSPIFSGIRIPWAVFLIPKPTISNSKAYDFPFQNKIFPDWGFGIPGRLLTSSLTPVPLIVRNQQGPNFPTTATPSKVSWKKL